MAMWIFDRLQSMGEQRYLLRHLFVSSELTQLTLIMVRDIWKREQKDAFGWGGFGGNEGKKTMFFCVLLYLLKKGRIHLRCEDKAVVWNMAKMGFQLLELDWFSVYGFWHGLFLSVHAHECLSRKIKNTAVFQGSCFSSVIKQILLEKIWEWSLLIHTFTCG